MNKLINKLEINLEDSNSNNTQLILNILKQQNNTQSNELKHNVEQIKNEKYPPDYSIQMISSRSNIFNSFDSTGKGIDKMNNWYLCNGRYGTPDLNYNKHYKYIVYSETISRIYINKYLSSSLKYNLK
jgi:pSer/pThr/pTyr-binding forkhead associated (FHA) protein